MSNPFRACGSNNGKGFDCWLSHGHRGVHEVHPFYRRQTSRPVWSDAEPAPLPTDDVRDSDGLVQGAGETDDEFSARVEDWMFGPQDADLDPADECEGAP